MKNWGNIRKEKDGDLMLGGIEIYVKRTTDPVSGHGETNGSFSFRGDEDFASGENYYLELEDGRQGEIVIKRMQIVSRGPVRVRLVAFRCLGGLVQSK